jgi:trimethylamine--corrinoid protein Co-methyltransferase
VDSFSASFVSSEQSTAFSLETFMRPSIQFLHETEIEAVVEEAKRILQEVGVLIEHAEAVELLDGAGASVDGENRVRITLEMVDAALAKTSPEVVLYDRDGENPVRLGGEQVNFAPGSAAIKVYDYQSGETRASTTRDCALFARLTDALPSIALQSTCVVPSDVPLETADRHRLALALENGVKPIITGTFAEKSFDAMRRMLVAVRGSEELLRAKPLAVFDCCPTSPLSWSRLTCSALMEGARGGIPVELISVPMTGATSPVTLLGAITQHTAENLSGLVIHQLAVPGAPVVYGACTSAFDMRRGTSPMGAVETMMMNSATAQIGKHLKLPTHAYMSLSDSKLLDYQAGLESGFGAILAAMSGINVVSGPGMMEFVSCQSPEKLILDSEGCAMALRAIRGIERREEVMALDVVKGSLNAGQFLNARHTRNWFRKELHFPGSTIDRQVREAWLSEGGKSAADRAHEELQHILAGDGAEPLDPATASEFRNLLAM